MVFAVWLVTHVHMYNVIGQVVAEAAAEVARMTPTLEISDNSDPFNNLDTDIGEEDGDKLQTNELVVNKD